MLGEPRSLLDEALFSGSFLLQENSECLVEVMRKFLEPPILNPEAILDAFEVAAQAEHDSRVLLVLHVQFEVVRAMVVFRQCSKSDAEIRQRQL